VELAKLAPLRTILHCFSADLITQLTVEVPVWRESPVKALN